MNKIEMLIQRWERRIKKLDEMNFWGNQGEVEIEIKVLRYCVTDLKEAAACEIMQSAPPKHASQSTIRVKRVPNQASKIVVEPQSTTRDRL